jgi:hypothetical protein
MHFCVLLNSKRMQQIQKKNMASQYGFKFIVEVWIIYKCSMFRRRFNIYIGCYYLCNICNHVWQSDNIGIQFILQNMKYINWIAHFTAFQVYALFSDGLFGNPVHSSSIECEVTFL